MDKRIEDVQVFSTVHPKEARAQDHKPCEAAAEQGTRKLALAHRRHCKPRSRRITIKDQLPRNTKRAKR
jgi:hypothetical protein